MTRNVVWFLVLLPVVYMICVWISAANYDAGVSPSGVQDIAGFVRRFGEPHDFKLVSRDGQTYYEVLGGVYPRYTFDMPRIPPDMFLMGEASLQIGVLVKVNLKPISLTNSGSV